jgi:hypothetical protein
LNTEKPNKLEEVSTGEESTGLFQDLGSLYENIEDIHRPEEYDGL